MTDDRAPTVDIAFKQYGEKFIVSAETKRGVAFLGDQTTLDAKQADALGNAALDAGLGVATGDGSCFIEMVFRKAGNGETQAWLRNVPEDASDEIELLREKRGITLEEIFEQATEIAMTELARGTSDD
jgi:hypothetical protein